MKKINDGGPAFPSHGSMGEVAQEGMSLRDYFAGKALAGWLASYDSETNSDVALAEYSYKLADAMLAERNKNEKV